MLLYSIPYKYAWVVMCVGVVFQTTYVYNLIYSYEEYLLENANTNIILYF